MIKEKNKTCPYCGESLPEKATFCPFCMNKLVHEEIYPPQKSTPSICHKKKLIIANAIVLVITIGLGLVFAARFSSVNEQVQNNTPFGKQIATAQSALNYQKQIPISNITMVDKTNYVKEGYDQNAEISTQDGLQADVWYAKDKSGVYVFQSSVDEKEAPKACQLIEIIFRSFNQDYKDTAFLNFLNKNLDFSNLKSNDMIEGREVTGQFGDYQCSFNVIASPGTSAEGLSYIYNLQFSAEKTN